MTWRDYVLQSHRLHSAYAQLASLIPDCIPEKFRISPHDFSRDRKLPFAHLISLLLSCSASDKNCGLSIKASEYFKDARRSGLLKEAQGCSDAALRAARGKVPWELFEDVLSRAVELANQLWVYQPGQLWHGMSVYAVDGSQYTVPASKQLRGEFDPYSGLEYKSKGHYPQCLVSTVYDVFRRLPIARAVDPSDGSERQQAESLLPRIPAGGVFVGDRGYPSYDLLSVLSEKYVGHFLLRCMATNTFPAVEEFLRSKCEDAVIAIRPTKKYLARCSSEEKRLAGPLKVRIVRMKSPDGTLSALLTNLFDEEQFTTSDLTELYQQRYRIEEYYRHEKVVIEVERFHSKSPNGIRQELYSAVIVSVIARLLINLTRSRQCPERIQPQFKHAAITFAREAFLLTPTHPQCALVVFTELLSRIEAIKQYGLGKKRASVPRVTKRTPNKWCDRRSSRRRGAKLKCKA